MIKILEFVGVYNKDLEPGNQLKNKTISIINRSEVVGRPLAALLGRSSKFTSLVTNLATGVLVNSYKF